jgi:hypothetical protein
VQAVLRNGQVYRELYGKQKAQLASDVADTSTEPPARIANLVLASKTVAKRAPKMTAKTATRSHPAAVSLKSTKPASTARKRTGSSTKKRAA